MSQGPGQFLAATAIASLGGGGGAAMSSLALSLLPTPTEAGKLFGSWSIMSAISTTILGPTVSDLVCMLRSFTDELTLTVHVLPTAVCASVRKDDSDAASCHFHS